MLLRRFPTKGLASARYDEAVALLRRVQEIQPREQVARYLEQVERLSRAKP